jgi:DNA-binding MarR family transcriptional regulator
MQAGMPQTPDTDALARAAEAFVLVWSSMPADLPEKISASQLRALVTVRRRGVTTVTALARDLSALPSSATRLCDRLVAAGYLDRAPAATNRRFHAISLTPAGERLLDVLDRHRHDAIAEVVARMDADARDRLLTGLTAFAAAARQPDTTDTDTDTGDSGDSGADVTAGATEASSSRSDDGTRRSQGVPQAHPA